jgi:bifunctional non-homologous end joining protein LigD
MPTDHAVEIAGVAISHPDRVLFPETGLTKRGLAEFYLRIADRILPHVVNRPLTVVRCPEGESGECFYQKHPPDGSGPYLRRLEIEDRDGPGIFFAINSLQGLIYLVQNGTLEFHPWGCRADRVEYPDRLIFDLDPDPAVPWRQVIAGAGQVHDSLTALGLVNFLKTTGGKGLHIVAPLARRRTWEEVREFAQAFAVQMQAEHPETFTLAMPKDRRHGRIFLDHFRNSRGAMTVAAYSTRAQAGAPVSTPVAWQELTPALKSNSFTVENLPARLAALKREPWAGFEKVRQGITERMRREPSG